MDRRIGIMATLAAAALAGCASQEHYDRMLNGWVGRHVDELVLQWGPPDKSATLSDGGTVIEYDRQRTVTTGGYTDVQAITPEGGGKTIYVPVTTPPTTDVLSCATRFVVTPERRIRSWSHDGNDCTALPPG